MKGGSGASNACHDTSLKAPMQPNTQEIPTAIPVGEYGQKMGKV
jgi:hypothetical protein